LGWKFLRAGIVSHPGCEQQLENSRSASHVLCAHSPLLNYHSVIHTQGVPMEDVLRVLRKRFTQSGLEEKASRKPKQ
jgi:hypothetical protein